MWNVPCWVGPNEVTAPTGLPKAMESAVARERGVRGIHSPPWLGGRGCLNLQPDPQRNRSVVLPPEFASMGHDALVDAAALGRLVKPQPSAHHDVI